MKIIITIVNYVMLSLVILFGPIFDMATPFILLILLAPLLFYLFFEVKAFKERKWSILDWLIICYPVLLAFSPFLSRLVGKLFF